MVLNLGVKSGPGEDLSGCRNTIVNIQTDRHTDIHRYTDTHIQTYRHTDIHAYILIMDIYIYAPKHIKTLVSFNHCGGAKFQRYPHGGSCTYDDFDDVLI